MLSKCANAGCSAPFLYFHRGRLFRFEAEGAPGNEKVPGFGADPEIRRPPRRIEYFWLCEICCAQVTLIYRNGQGVVTTPVARSKSASL
jgi:hypothetical protein